MSEEPVDRGGEHAGGEAGPPVGGAGRAEPLTVKSFFAADPSRRGSRDVGFGEGWRSAEDVEARFCLYWLASTGECWLMRVGPTTPDLFEAGGDLGLVGVAALAIGGLVAHGLRRHHRPDHQELEVEVLASAVSEEDVRQRLEGWEAAMHGPDGVRWLHSRLQA